MSIPKKQSTPFDSSFNDFIFERCEVIFQEQIFTNSDFQVHSTKSLNALEAILKDLSNEQRRLYNIFESENGVCQSLTQRIEYEQGLKDGILLGKILGR